MIGRTATGSPQNGSGVGTWPAFWRVEGALVEMTAVRPVAYFTWNAQTFAERWGRRGGLFLEALIRPALYFGNPVFATRMLHALLQDVSRDRLELLGEREYFHYILKPHLKPAGLDRLRVWMAEHGQVVLVSQGLDQVMRPLAGRHLGVERLIANRLEFRDGGTATGRLLDPVVPPRGPLAMILGGSPDGLIPAERLLHDLKLEREPQRLAEAIIPAARPAPRNHRSLVLFDQRKAGAPLSVRKALRGKNILLIGVTGFIGKVWLEQVLREVPEIGKVYLLIRRQRTTTGRRRFEKIVEESPVFDSLAQQYGSEFDGFLSEKIEVLEGDVSQPGLGLDGEASSSPSAGARCRGEQRRPDGF